MSTEIKNHPVTSHEEFVAAHTAHLKKEKEFTRLRDDLSRQRRELPWEKVTKTYVFDGPNGRETLADLFGTRSQLIVYHFMFPPEWEEGCKHCSFWADNFDGVVVHMNHRDTSFVTITRAPSAKIQGFEQKMGWTFKWLSSGENDFNHDFGVSFTAEESKQTLYNYGTMASGFSDREGMSVFYKDGNGDIFHTYSAYARGIDMFNTAYHYIDTTPKGRDEGNSPQSWLHHHDRYPD